jgi:hypothetical protein
VSGAVNVPTNALVQIAFSERIDPQTVHSGTFTLAPQNTGIPINASYLVSADGRSATLVPAAALSASTAYSASANGIADLVGQTPFASWSFTTGAGARTTAPVVTRSARRPTPPACR